MKILIVNGSVNGGAFTAAIRHHKALLSVGVESKMLTCGNVRADSTIIGSKSYLSEVASYIRAYLDLIPWKLHKNRSATLFSTSWVQFSSLPDQINALKPDIVHLHWICAGVMSIEDIGRIKSPIVWTLHDMWTFTGGCHYNNQCEKYTTNCGKCPVLGSNRTNDLSHYVFNRKKNTYSKFDNMTVVCLSSWMQKCAEKSILLKKHTIVKLPNCINSDSFKNHDKMQAKTILGLPMDKKIILFGACDPTSDPRKGFRELNEAMKQIDCDKYYLLIFGANENAKCSLFKQKTRYLGYLNDELSLCIAYSAADLVVVPSLQENLSNVIMESLACGTPVVCFDTGGNKDMVVHKYNGYLANAFDASDLANGIMWVSDNCINYDLFSNSRKMILEHFDSKKIAKQYCELYEMVLKK